MNESEMLRIYADAQGCGLTVNKTPFSTLDENAPLGVRPIPCVRDERGLIKKQPLKVLLAKIDEEMNEFKEAIIDGNAAPIAEEAADTITAITTLLEGLGFTLEMRDEAQRRVNAKNRERNRL